MTREDAASIPATLHYVRLEPGDRRYHFWRLAKRERVPVDHDGKPHTLLSWTELLDPYQPGPSIVEVTLMLAADYAAYRQRRRDLERKLAARPARPGSSEGSLLVTRVRKWRGTEGGRAAAGAATCTPGDEPEAADSAGGADGVFPR
jgi:hypothetical protein